jgi:hypothetical protein
MFWKNALNSFDFWKQKSNRNYHKCNIKFCCPVHGYTQANKKGMGSFEQQLQYILSMFNSVLDFETKTFVFILAYTYGQNKPKNSLPIYPCLFFLILWISKTKIVANLCSYTIWNSALLDCLCVEKKSSIQP